MLFCQVVASVSPRVVGVDDRAWRKSQRYGTILCDIERGKVIDLLPDRSTESTAEWLMTHPGIEIISRDRASLYAEAVAKAVINCSGRQSSSSDQMVAL